MAKKLFGMLRMNCWFENFSNLRVSYEKLNFIIYIYIYIYIFLHVQTREGGAKIRTSDLNFMRHSLQPIKLPLGDSISQY
jgi:hypothetical protein